MLYLTFCVGFVHMVSCWHCILLLICYTFYPKEKPSSSLPANICVHVNTMQKTKLCTWLNLFKAALQMRFIHGGHISVEGCHI